MKQGCRPQAASVYMESINAIRSALADVTQKSRRALQVRVVKA